VYGFAEQGLAVKASKHSASPAVVTLRIMKAHKFSDQVLPGAASYVYPNVWAVGKTAGPERLVIAPSFDQVGLMIELSRILPEPFGILYVLLVSRCGNEPSRYQSPYPCAGTRWNHLLDISRSTLSRMGDTTSG